MATEKPINQKLKEVTYYILSKCCDKKTFGKTVLFKLMYFSDFNFYKLHHKSITGGSYKKLPFGPAPCDFDSVMNNLSDEGKIEVIIDDVDGAYTFKVKENLKIETLDKEELDMVDKVISKIGHHTAKEISELSHKDTPWQVTGEKEIIDYDLVFYRDNEVALKVE